MYSPYGQRPETPGNRQSHPNEAYSSATVTPPPATRQNYGSGAYNGNSVTPPPQSYPPHQTGPSVPPPRGPYPPQQNGAYNAPQPHPREGYQPYGNEAYNGPPVPPPGHNQQTYANGAYNGPPIPPPGANQQTYQNGGQQGASVPPPSNNNNGKGKSGGGSGCGFFSCCCSMFTSVFGCLGACLCTCLCQIIMIVLIIGGIGLFIGWLIFKPKSIVFYPNSAVLTEFNLNDNTLKYNLALNYTIRNPNKRMGINYDQITAYAFYHDQEFTTIELPGFHQGHRKETTVNAVFKGQNNNFKVPHKKLSKINKERGNALYGIDVKLQLRVRMKFLFFKLMKLNPKADCDMMIPLNSDGKASKSFEPKACRFRWFKYII